jgi:PKD domain
MKTFAWEPGRRTVRVLITALLMSGVPVIAWQHAATAATPVVTANSDSAEIDGNEFADSTHQRFFGADNTNFLTFAQHRAPAKQSAPEGTASLFESESATLETPDGTFPVQPLNDVAVSGTVKAGATSTGVGPAVPNSDSQGLFDVTFTLDSPTAVFFSGFMQVANNDAADSCSEASVVLAGPDTASSRKFTAHRGVGCSVTGPPSTGFAQTITLPAGDYDLSIDYDTAVDANPGEPSSRSGSATLTTNLSFLPPTATFTKTLSGSVGHFNGSASSAGLAGRPLAKWEWTFGDGKHATTTGPKVSHTYPASPAHARTYRVSLQVVDNGGSVSPPVTHTVVGTATSLSLAKTATRVTAKGQVLPNRSGHRVSLTLARKSAGAFRTIATHRPTLGSTSRFTTTFPRPAPGTCRMTARYAGDASHLASVRVTKFAC